MAPGPNQISQEALSRAALALFEEAFHGPADPKGTWFVDNEPSCGFIGVLAGLTASDASKRLSTADPATVASHAGHLFFSLSLANRAAKGENPYAGVSWKESWRYRVVDEEEWAGLVSALRREYETFKEVIGSGAMWDNEELLTGALAQIAHGAWHLGAIRQGLGLVKST